MKPATIKLIISFCFFTLFQLPVSANEAAANSAKLPQEIRIGYQKYGTLFLLKLRGGLETRLAPLGVGVKWSEFPFGPPMLEALNADKLDYASTGETPPVFAQAAKASKLVYVGHEQPSPQSEAILIPEHSAISNIGELKDKKVAVAKGSNAHFLLISALAAAGLSLKDIQLVSLPPADVRAAFERGAIDAWAIWDFYRAAAEFQLHAKVLSDGQSLVQNYEIYTSRKTFAEQYPELLKIVLEEVNKEDAHIRDDPQAAAEQLSKQIGVAQELLLTSIKRRVYGASAVTSELLANQQKIADTLFSIGLIPQSLRIEDAVLKH
jgi:sulfonate transport system substrate-binding protein